MKVRPSIFRTALAAVIAGGAWLTSGVVLAQEAPPHAPYGQAHLIPVDVTVEIGLHGDRYWDGHRYWSHDEWMHRHPHDRDPWRHDHDRRFRPHRDGEPHRY